MGPTPLSDFVCLKADQIDAEIKGMLNANAETECDLFARAFEVLPEECHNSCRDFIISSILRLRAGWSYKVLSRVRKFPLVLLRMLQHPRLQESELRVNIARELFDVEGNCCLRDPMGDVHIKFKLFFRAEWELVIANKGKVPARC